MADVRLRDLNPAVLDYGLTVAGSVGIGTTSPATTLDIHDSGGTGLRVLRGTVDLRLSDNASNGNVGTESNHNLYIRTNSTDRITITNTGLVGIGEGAPGYELEVAAAANSAEIGIKGTSGNNALVVFKEVGDIKGFVGIEGSTDILKLVTGATFGGSVKGINIDSSGFVGIGTTAPAYKLHVYDDDYAYTHFTTSEFSTGFTVGINDDLDEAIVRMRENKPLTFWTNNLERMHISNGGNVGIGTTSPATELQIGDYTDAAETITIATSDNGTGRINFYDNNATEGGSIRVTGASNGSKMHFANRWNTDADKVTFDLINGRVGIGTTSPTETLHVNGNLKVTGTVDVGSSGFSVSTGFILAFGVAAPPSGWLACNGSAVSRTTYSDLYALIGTTYGAGDGSTTFNVPDLRGRTLIGTDGLAAGSFTANLGTLDNIGGIGGAQNHTLTTAELPSHTHSQTGQSGCDDDNCNGGWSASIYEHRASSRSRNTVNNINSTGGGGSHNTVQPSLAISYLIKT